jgi:hypothetical protein
MKPNNSVDYFIAYIVLALAINEMFFGSCIHGIIFALFSNLIVNQISIKKQIYENKTQ